MIDSELILHFSLFQKIQCLLKGLSPTEMLQLCGNISEKLPIRTALTHNMFTFEDNLKTNKQQAA